MPFLLLVTFINQYIFYVYVHRIRRLKLKVSSYAIKAMKITISPIKWILKFNLFHISKTSFIYIFIYILITKGTSIITSFYEWKTWHTHQINKKSEEQIRQQHSPKSHETEYPVLPSERRVTIEHSSQHDHTMDKL